MDDAQDLAERIANKDPIDRTLEKVWRVVCNCGAILGVLDGQAPEGSIIGCSSCRRTYRVKYPQQARIISLNNGPNRAQRHAAARAERRAKP